MQQLSERSARAPHRHSDHARGGLYGSGATRRHSHRRLLSGASRSAAVPAFQRRLTGRRGRPERSRTIVGTREDASPASGFVELKPRRSPANKNSHRSLNTNHKDTKRHEGTKKHEN